MNTVNNEQKRQLDAGDSAPVSDNTESSPQTPGSPKKEIIIAIILVSLIAAAVYFLAK